ncbi:DUF6152 family protein [Herbidospora yilanensis]|uniref:DUF6152 family protein n=1 Tax=Herbidospora yilanensis TaxID=354426 RepID=UPI0007C7397D|nr:DUF6152 family protein [Herbidospora yilanensis]
MSSLDGTTLLTRARARLLRLATASLAFAMVLVVFPVRAAHAHHGWDDFDTDRLYYIAGTVSEVRWGEPHSFFTVTLDNDLPGETPELALPEQLQAPEDSGPIKVAPSYRGSHEALEVVIAPPTYTGMWGLDRPLADGEQVELVGYINKSHDDEFRPVVFWFETGKPVNQVLGSELPAKPLPVPYPVSAAPDHAPAAAEDSEGTSAIVVWIVLAAGLIVVVAGGAVYLRARSRRDV